jgi:hypothetical protein
MKVAVAKASMEKFSVSKASMHKFSVAKASSSSAPDEIDELRRLPYIGYNQARLNGSR